MDSWTTDELLSKIWGHNLQPQVSRSQFVTIKIPSAARDDK
jgi:hypothetical protein